MGKKRRSAGSNKKQPQNKSGGFLAGPRGVARDGRGELRRGSLPDLDQLRQRTGAGLFIVLVPALYVSAIDFVVPKLVGPVFL